MNLIILITLNIFFLIMSLTTKQIVGEIPTGVL